MNTHELPIATASEDSEAPFRYFPLPHTDVGALRDRKISAVLKQHGYHLDPRGSGLVLNEESGESLMLFGVVEATATRVDAHWDILRAMDARSKKVRQQRLFPYDSPDESEHGRVVSPDHPAYGHWFDLTNGAYNSFEIHGARISWVLIALSGASIALFFAVGAYCLGW